MPAKDPAAYMREYRARKRTGAVTAATEDATTDVQDLATLEAPVADWRSLPPVDALVTLARALPDVKPIDGADIIPPRPGILAAPDARWRSLAPRIAFGSLSANIAALALAGAG